MMQIMGTEVKECGTGFEVKTLQNEAIAGLSREFLSLVLAACMQMVGIGAQ